MRYVVLSFGRPEKVGAPIWGPVLREGHIIHWYVPGDQVSQYEAARATLPEEAQKSMIVHRALPWPWPRNQILDDVPRDGTGEETVLVGDDLESLVEVYMFSQDWDEEPITRGITVPQAVARLRANMDRFQATMGAISASPNIKVRRYPVISGAVVTPLLNVIRPNTVRLDREVPICEDLLYSALLLYYGHNVIMDRGIVASTTRGAPGGRQARATASGTSRWAQAIEAKRIIEERVPNVIRWAPRIKPPLLDPWTFHNPSLVAHQFPHIFRRPGDVPLEDD